MSAGIQLYGAAPRVPSTRRGTPEDHLGTIPGRWPNSEASSRQALQVMLDHHSVEHRDQSPSLSMEHLGGHRDPHTPRLAGGVKKAAGEREIGIERSQIGLDGNRREQRVTSLGEATVDAPHLGGVVHERVHRHGGQNVEWLYPVRVARGDAVVVGVLLVTEPKQPFREDR